jgi:glycosyltransferase involved in cell wall biosynthesis
MPRMNRFGLTVIFALAMGVPVALAQNNHGQQDHVPRLDHVFVIVLENHNSFTSFGSNGIIGRAPHV